MSDYYTRPDGTQIAITAMGREELIGCVRVLARERDEALAEIMRLTMRSGLDLQDAANDVLDVP